MTRVVEHALAENSKIEKLESTTRAGVAVVTINLDPSVKDTAKEFDDIWLKLSNLGGLPSGATLQFKKDFGDTSALMLSVASPRASSVDVQLRADSVMAAIEKVRADAPAAVGPHATLIACYPFSLDAREFAVIGQELAAFVETRGAERGRVLSGRGFLDIDERTRATPRSV